MRRVVVTPAGRRRYLEVLFRNLARERSGFDLWKIWVNTISKSDVDYCRSLARGNDWVEVVEIKGIRDSSITNIHRFFPTAMDPGSVYVRLDDDIVWIEPGFFDSLFGHRLKHRRPFLVYANIINNAVVSHIHQRNGLIDHDFLCGYSCMDPVGWGSPEFAEKVHRSFLSDMSGGRLSLWRESFRRWVLHGYERVSINAVSWLGSDMAMVGGVSHSDEEGYLSVGMPSMLGRPNEIFGGALASHFAFYTQRQHMDGTDLLSRYAALS